MSGRRTCRARSLIGAFFAIGCLGLAGYMAQEKADGQSKTGTLRVSVIDEITGKLTPARIELLDDKGKEQIPKDALQVGGD